MLTFDEDLRYCTSAEVVLFYARRLHEAAVRLVKGGSFVALLCPVGVLERYGVAQATVDAVIRSGLKGLDFPGEMFP